MKYLLCLVLSLSFASCAKKPTQREMLIGKWRDENSLVEYKADGTKTAKYDRGPYMEGIWVLEGDIIKFTPAKSRSSKSTDHKIISLTTDELVIEHLPDMKRYHAKRVK